jgi:exopolysaccharide production protein ExoZ
VDTQFFYLVFGAALWLRLRNAWVWVAATMLALVALGFYVKFTSVELSFWTAPIILEFVFGLLLYQAWKRWRPKFAAIPLPVAGLGIIACLVGQAFFDESYFVDRAFIFGPAAAIIVGLGLSLENRVVLPRLFLRVGDASYSLYLLNIYVLVAFDKLADAFIKNSLVEIALIPVAFAACIGLALCSFEWIEHPSNRWLRASLHRWPFSRPQPQAV